MRKVLVSSMLAVALLAMVGSVSRVHAAAPVPSTTCVNKYWALWAEAYVYGEPGNNGYTYDFRAYELRDVYNNAYCGKVYTKVGVTIPLGGRVPPWIKIYLDNYVNGNFLSEYTIYYNNTNGCYLNPPCWDPTGSQDQFGYSLGGGHHIQMEARIQIDTGSWPSTGVSPIWYL